MTKTSEMMLCAFLKQGVEKLSDTESIHRDPSISLRKLLQRKPPFQLKLEETCQLLVQTIKRFQRFYICIDAMDECLLETCKTLLASLAKVSRDCNGECLINIFVTGRISDHMNWAASKTACGIWVASGYMSEGTSGGHTDVYCAQD